MYTLEILTTSGRQYAQTGITEDQIGDVEASINTGRVVPFTDSRASGTTFFVPMEQVALLAITNENEENDDA